MRRFLAAWIFSVFLFSYSHAASGTIKVHFIDIGYGNAILIELPNNETVLIDAGSATHSSHLINYLNSQGIGDLDTAILTHPHEDHFGGFLDLFKDRPIKKFFSNGDDKRADDGYDDLIQFISESQIPVTVLREGDVVSLSDKEVRISVLHPSSLDGSVNENVLVLRVIFGNTSFLLTSDIPTLQQEKILKSHPFVKTANVVQVPHHGGHISGQFANAFGGDVIYVVSTGANKYGRPYQEELGKLKGTILRTDVHGPVVLHSDGHRVKVIDEGYEK